MLTQLSRSLSTKFDNASYGIAVVRPNQRPVTAAPTAAIPSISCRYRIKPGRYPLQFIQEKMKTEKFRKVTLTLNQYLATVRGTPHYGIHAPINKKVRTIALIFSEPLRYVAFAVFAWPNLRDRKTL
jgi:hypothetical protein